MSTDFVFKQRLHLCSVSNLKILMVFQRRTFKVGFSGPKTFRDFRQTGPRAGLLNWIMLSMFSPPRLSISFLIVPIQTVLTGITIMALAQNCNKKIVCF